MPRSGILSKDILSTGAVARLQEHQKSLLTYLWSYSCWLADVGSLKRLRQTTVFRMYRSSTAHLNSALGGGGGAAVINPQKAQGLRFRVSGLGFLLESLQGYGPFSPFKCSLGSMKPNPKP